MRRPLLALLAALALLLAACDGDSADEAVDDAPDATAPDTPAAEPVEDEPEALDDDTAARVNGTDIPRAEVEDRLDSAAERDEEFRAQLEGEEGDALREVFRANTLTAMIQARIVLEAAADEGVQPSEEQVQATREEFAVQFGGDEGLEEAIARSGMSEEDFQDQVHSVAALEAMRERFAEEDADVDVEGVDPADAALQQWLAERFAAAEVAVHPDLGQWDAASGSVIANGVLDQLPEEGLDDGEAPLDDEDADADGS